MADGTRSRRRWIVLGVFALLLGLGWWFVDRQLEPQRLTATVLSRLGAQFKLDFEFSGTPEYAFRPEPRLRVPNLVVTDPATGKTVLRAKQLEVSLPWATVRGGPVVITRLVLDEPVLDLDGLQRWLAARPKAPFELPTLTDGAAVTHGTVVGNGWELRDLTLDLPHLSTGNPADLAYGLRFVRGATDVHARGKLHLATAGPASDYTLLGGVALARADKPVAAAHVLAGHFGKASDGFAVSADTFKLDGKSPLPHVAGRAKALFGEQLVADFAGTLANWPESWPALPTPLNAGTGPFPLTLAYRGAGDFSDPLVVGLSMGPARLDAQARVPAMLAWLEAPPTSPLPPLTGTLTLPQLDLEGITLRGVRVDMDEGDSAAATEPAVEAGAKPARGR
jgi:hypothetical protein